MKRPSPSAVAWTAVAILALCALYGSSQGLAQQLTLGRAAAIARADAEPAVGLQAEFLGQDGHGHVGINCTSDPTPDNIHIAVRGVREDIAITGWEVHDVQGCGHWIYPCNHFNWWLQAVEDKSGTVHLYVKPHRSAPAGTLYVVIARYADASSDTTMVSGSEVTFCGFGCGYREREPLPLPPTDELQAEFLGQDGHGYVGPDCRLDPTPDNIHIRVRGVPTEAALTSYQVDDPRGHGRWVYPCNSFNWWLHATSDVPGTVDLFVKPHRDAPDGTPYSVTLRYADGSANRVEVNGSQVRVRR